MINLKIKPMIAKETELDEIAMMFTDKGIKSMKGNFLRTKVTSVGTLISLMVVLCLIMCSTSAFAGAPAKNAYTAIVDSGATLQPDTTPQDIGTTTVTLTSGGLAVTTFTVTIDATSTVAAGEVTAVEISDGTNTWSATGSYGPGSAVACSGNATPVDAATMTIRVTLAAASAGKTVGVELTSSDSGSDTGLPTAGALHNIFAPADTLTVTTNTAVATSGNPSQLDVQMQYLQVDSDNTDDGAIELTTVTVDDLGTAAAGDIDNLKIHIDADTDFANGVLDTVTQASWDGTSLAVDITAITLANRTVNSGTSKYIWVTYDLNAGIVDGTTLQSSVTDIAVAASDNGATGTWSSNNFATSSGPSNTLADCGGCHNYPPVDGLRDPATGNFVGDHDKHNAYTCATCHVAPGSETSVDFAHRTGDLDLDSGNIGVGADNGTYSKGATFAQSNAPTTGTCSLVDCHNNAVTPQWGVGTTACDTCHALPPATNAHSTHYTAKGWATGNTTNCTQCHPDNTAGHSDVTDNSVIVNAGLTPAGTSPAITCAATGTGCHNGTTTPAWNIGTAIACTDCHTVGGTNDATTANPVSGLHNMAAAGVQKHDDTISANKCGECHAKASIAGHWDGTASATADYNSVAAGISFASGTYTDAGGTAASRGTCNSTCHADSGNWERQWSTAADSTVTTAGDAHCDVCHGQLGNWRTGSSHEGTFNASASNRGNSHNSLGGANNACEDCHSYPSLANHEDGNITMNDGGATTVTNTGNPNNRIYCAKCHSDDGAPATSGTHTFPASSFTLLTVSGANDPVGSCTSCHGGATVGTTEKNYWPDNDVGNTHAANDDPNGRHLFHITQIASVLYSETVTGAADDDILMDNTTANPGVTSDTKQKAICEYCHAANTNDGDHTNTYPADVFVDADAVRHASTLWATADADASYDDVADTCSNIDCHNSKLTTDGTYGWYDAGTTDCLMCHVGGTTDPTSGLHTGTPTVSSSTHDNTLDAAGCEKCHTASPSTTHINGTADTPDTFDGTIGYSAGATPTCTASACHSDGGAWSRKWSNTALNSNGTECANCHGDFASGFVTGMSLRHQTSTAGDTGGEIEANHDGTNKCLTCHAYDGADTYGHKWATHHRDGVIQISDQAGFVDNGTTVGCSGCHASADGTADGGHEFTDTTAANGWTRVTVAGPAADCASCHASGKSGAIVTSASPHVITTVGGAFNACTDCHPGGSVGSMHSATGAIGVANNTTTGIDINYQDGVSGGGAYSGYAGIVLGGDDANAAPGTLTEAEWCWQCHQAQTTDISEWDGSTASYDYGSVTADNLNWTTTSWLSAVFSYKDGLLNAAPGTQANASTHGTNGGAAGVDALANISCTYCHDVHDTAGGSTGAPFLRGNWTSNPFKEDGAPGQPGSVATWTDSFARGNVPRATASLGTATNNEYGGWQTEDNNTYTRAANATTHAGLCLSCHTEANLVTAWNSHANVVDGFTASGALDIYDVSHRMNTSYAEAGDVRFAYPHHLGIGTDDTKKRAAFGGSSSAGYIAGYRDGNAIKDSFMTDTAGKPGNGDAEALTAHVATLTGNVVDAQFHQFPCSKCHNPHASRLPKLMITNCLDVQKNAWDDTLDTTGWAAGSGITTGTVRYTATQLGYSSTAGNCHRYVMSTDANADDGQVTSPSNRGSVTQGGGWNKVTPW